MAVRNVEIDDKKFKIAYDIINPNKEKNIIFLHGWGSNKEIMKVFSNNFNDFRHIYIDMPGFGKSSNDYILTTFDYAKIMDKFLNELNIKKDIIIGHSFGGKVATLLKPDLLVLLASAGIVLPKPINIRLKIKFYKTLKFLGLSKFRKYFVSKDAKGMNENMYETFKKVVDEDFSEIFRNYKGKVLIFGGDEDTAVPPKSVKKQGELLKSKIIMLNGNHYFFFNSPNMNNAKENRKKIEKKIKKVI
ncbi:alpha/beta fold hydrolase [Lebetimonas sp. JH292]|uniref:alpha/beta fold hydrolase n=1 Tax=Lebetimonas sp. JH292 TaxID=990068 RepID=UPI0004679FC8|nr:alpha/beta hydrolase [Lebetimonas sp. JH292]